MDSSFTQDQQEELELEQEEMKTDELEELSSNIDTHSEFTSGSHIEKLVSNFTLHKRMKEALEQELSCKADTEPK